MARMNWNVVLELQPRRRCTGDCRARVQHGVARGEGGAPAGRGVGAGCGAAVPLQLQCCSAHLYGLYLSNLCGDLLAYPGATQTFDFDRWQRILIQQSFPQVAALVDGRAEAAVLSQPVTENEEARVFAFERMLFGNADEARFMVAGLSQPLAVVQGDVLDWGRTILKLLPLLCVVGVAWAARVAFVSASGARLCAVHLLALSHDLHL